jgi:hypothetical protein
MSDKEKPGRFNPLERFLYEKAIMAQAQWRKSRNLDDAIHYLDCAIEFMLVLTPVEKPKYTN